MTKTNGNVILQQQIAKGIYSLIIETEIALTAKPGQFVSLYCRGESKLLPRPISICQIDKKNMTIRLVYRVVGKGTTEFSTYTNGDKVSLMGPLGNGFPVNEIETSSKVILVGGGIGVPPMVECANALKKRGVKTCSVMGYRDGETFLKEEFEEVSKYYVATEDGSVGTRGNVIDAISLNRIKGDVIFACGPKPMLAAVKNYARIKGMTCFVSMEERMACGIGACLGCVCKSREVDEHSKVNNVRVCKDGPVFLADDIIL